nr:MAG TPA: hypothetical protein [Caudoviricetes sp.]
MRISPQFLEACIKQYTFGITARQNAELYRP